MKKRKNPWLSINKDSHQCSVGVNPVEREREELMYYLITDN